MFTRTQTENNRVTSEAYYTLLYPRGGKEAQPSRVVVYHKNTTLPQMQEMVMVPALQGTLRDLRGERLSGSIVNDMRTVGELNVGEDPIFIQLDADLASEFKGRKLLFYGFPLLLIVLMGAAYIKGTMDSKKNDRAKAQA